MTIEVKTKKLLGGWITSADKAEDEVEVILYPTVPALKSVVRIPITSNPKDSIPAHSVTEEPRKTL